MSFAATHLIGFGAKRAAAAASTYRYFRWTATANVGGGAFFNHLFSAQLSTDNGSTWVPSSAMSNNTTPSPFVASAASASTDAWKAFDINNTTEWVGSVAASGSGAWSPGQWIQLDVGSGSEINPNKFRLAFYNTGGADVTWKDFTLKASNTGSFAGEETTLKTVTGQASQTHQTLVEYTIP